MSIRISIVGKPNVGKSTMFNKLCGRRLAIVHDRPGVTRDTKAYPAKLGDLEFELIDTAGLEFTKEMLTGKMVEHTLKAAKASDLLLFMVDARNGIAPDDFEFANIIRKLGKKMLLVANKSEGRKSVLEKDLRRIGFGEPIFISAEHNLGFRELEMAISAQFAEEVAKVKAMKKAAQLEAEMNFEVKPLTNREKAHEERTKVREENWLKLAIIGRPNVGKSSLFNVILGQERSIVSDVSGTTRDAISDTLIIDGRKVELIDTAGLRRKSKIDDSVEILSTVESINALRRASVIAVVLDALMPLEKQDLSIAHMAIKEGKGIVLVINKSDLIKDKKAYTVALDEMLERNLFEIRGVPVVYVSALYNKNISEIFKQAFIVEERWKTEIKTAKLNQWLRYASGAHIPPIATNGRRIRLKYATQTATKPTTITVFANMPDQLPDSYSRYLYNSLREAFSLNGVPIRLKYKKNDNPYADKE